jgi:hypothetical protein
MRVRKVVLSNSAVGLPAAVGLSAAAANINEIEERVGAITC